MKAVGVQCVIAESPGWKYHNVKTSADTVCCSYPDFMTQLIHVHSNVIASQSKALDGCSDL